MKIIVQLFNKKNLIKNRKKITAQESHKRINGSKFQVGYLDWGAIQKI